MLANAWLIPALPLLGVIINTIIGIIGLRRAAPAAHGHGHDHGHIDGPTARDGRLAGMIASATVGLSFVVALLIFFDLLALPAQGRSFTLFFFNWIATGSLNIPFAFLLDQLSIVMVLLVTGVGFLIHVYSIGYMSHEQRQVRYFSYLNLFVVSMLILVMANNYLLLFMGWEGVGLCSFLLIGFWFERKEAKSAAVKAFVVNRIGDFGLLLAMFATWKLTGTLTFREVFANTAPISATTFPFLGSDVTASGAIVFAMLLGVAGKSAQLPLYVWLPDAMAGPTPVSALIHAATMVTAGVYLMVRSDALIQLTINSTRPTILAIGALTAFMGAATAIGQYDIKKVLAYSTVSQLGYMVAAVGMGAPVAAMFHLLTHGFFKALLFLGSGSVIHGAGGNQDMRKMGGLKGKMPITYWTFIIGSLALVGIPPLAGFWSKDEIIGIASENAPGFWKWLLILGALMTAFYTVRMVILTFHGKQRDTSYTAHESPRLMTIPLIVLAGMTILGGLINFPNFSAGEFTGEGQPIHSPGFASALGRWLEPVITVPFEPPFHLVLALVLLAAVLASGFVAYWVYAKRPVFTKLNARDPLWRPTGIFYEMLEEKLWLDDLYQATIVRPFHWTARVMSSIFDSKVIDGAVNGTAWLVGKSGAGLRQLQTGYVRSYALFFLLGVVAILAYLVLR